MIKTLTRITVMIGLLAAGFFGYRQGFALLTRHFNASHTVPVLPHHASPSRGALEAQQLAMSAFGPGHWAIQAKIKYYDRARGYWIYAQDYRRQEDGRRWEFEPFALIWRSRGGSTLKTIVSQRAFAHFNQPADLVRGGGEETHIVRARIEGDVRIRDDKGTSRHLGDDMTIALRDLDYDRASETISSESPIEIRDRDTLATAVGLVIELLPTEDGRRPGSEAGYNGARTIRLLQDVKITAQDVGRTGIVPGGRRQFEEEGQPREPRPGEITCDGELRLDLPPPRGQPRVGPPAPPAPTYATFARNVRVRQGDAQNPEQIDCDRLFLTLLPEPRKPRDRKGAGSAVVVASTAEVGADSIADEAESAGDASAMAAAPEGGPVSDLVLDRARATGHAVWLQSKAQGLVARGNELRYQRGMGEAPDMTHFRGDRSTLIQKENAVDGTKDVIETVDVTLHHKGREDGPLTAVARGPGRLETRRIGNHALVRTATWNDKLVFQPVEDQPDQRQLTLDGSPTIDDVAQGSMKAKKKMIVALVPRPSTKEGPTDARAGDAEHRLTAEVASATPPQAQGTLGAIGTGAYQIQTMQAWGDVVLVSNEGGRTGEVTPTKASGSRTITARDWLGVVFEHPEVAAVAVDSTKRAEAAAAASRPAPMVPAPSDVQVAQRSTQPQAPTEPPMTVTADRIWAWLEQPAAATDAQPQQGPAADSETKGHKNGQKWNLREVRLRGDVIVHQDPAPDKERGLEMSGNEVDVISQGSKLYEVRAYGTVSAPARAVTDEFLIEGPIIGLDQAKNYACVIGPGKLIQENAGDGILGDIAAEPSIKQTSFTVIADETPRPADVEAKKQRGPLTIAWGRAPDGSTRDAGEGEAVQAWMKFYGRPTDTQGRPAAARAYFSNGVRAWTEDALLTCEQMWADLDDIVDFSNLPTRPGDAKTGGDTKGDESRERKRPQVARVLCQEAVRVVTRKHDEKGVLTEKRYVEGEKVTYDRATNTFHVDSAGRVDLYDRRDPKGNREAPESSQEDRREPTMASPGRGRVRPVSNRPEEPKRVRARPAKRDADPEGTAPLEMTRIWFEDQMIGQIQSTLVDTKRLAGQAEFFGDVRVMHAEVANEDAQLDPDDRPDNSIYTTSQTLRVISEPPRPGSPAGTPDRVLLQAWQDLYALSVRQGRETAIQSSDHMDYNSETGVSYIYGREDGVTIVDQTGLGQQASYGKGSTVIYNHKTGAHRVIDARSIQLVDDRTGVRAGIPPTAPERKRDKPKPRPIPRTPSGDKERRNFTGR